MNHLPLYTLTDLSNKQLETLAREAPSPDNYGTDLDNMIVLNDEQGNELFFEFLDLIEYNEEEYVVLLPCDDDQTGEVVILQIESANDDTESYIGVSDERVLNAVFEIFKEKYIDFFNFV